MFKEVFAHFVMDNIKAKTQQERRLKAAIACLQESIQESGYLPVVHFELEGMCVFQNSQSLDYSALNQELKELKIPGEVKPEYWPGQWEFVSDFAGQTPLEEASYLSRAMKVIPQLIMAQGAKDVFLAPVVWHGSKQKYIPGSDSIFGQHTGSVHVPNAIQVNVSIKDLSGKNLIPETLLGEWLQYHLLKNSLCCCLMFLPEEDAFQRLLLRTKYQLDDELSSPYELSGGHQGSVALYREKGKHNQPMGLTPLIFDQHNKPLTHTGDWRDTSRIEHRLGATSKLYDPFLNVMFILLNICEAISSWQNTDEAPPKWNTLSLPNSLGRDGDSGAIGLFEQDQWFESAIKTYCQKLSQSFGNNVASDIKNSFLDTFRKTLVDTSKK